MSLLAKKNIGLIFMSALLIFSCKEKEKIGLQLPEDNVGAFYTDTLSIITSVTIKNDDIATHNQNYLYTGAYHDPIFGDVSAEAYSSLRLKTENINTVGATITDVTLNLAYDYQYGDTTQNQSLNVYKLTGEIDKGKTFFSVTPDSELPSIDLSADIDDDLTFKLTPRSNPVVVVKLDNNLGNDILSFNGTGKINADFEAFFKGLAILPQAKNVGSLFRLKLFDNTSKVVIKYSIGGVDQTPFELLMNTSSGRFSRITSNKSATDLSMLSIMSTINPPIAGEVYLQSGIGIRSIIKFPTLENFKNKLGTIAINRAELVLEVASNTIKPALVNYDPVGLIQLVKLDNNGNVRKYTDTDGSLKDDVVQRDFFDVKGHTAPLSVNYDSTVKTYTCNVSSYFHGIINGLEENNGLIIAPHPLFSSTSVNRTLAGKVYMRIYYTKVD